MKKIFAMLACAGMLIASSCGSKTDNNTADSVDALSVDTVVANPEAFLGDTIVVEGVGQSLKHI